MAAPDPERWREFLPPALRDRFSGPPITIRFLPSLTNHRGKLLSAESRGVPVHDAAFLRRRELVLDHELRQNEAELHRILVHELFHFAWLRLGNVRRGGYEELLQAECSRNARGELGWSAENLRRKLSQADIAERTRRWREYACESFCDTAAWIYARQPGHGEYTLAAKWRERRAAWFDALFAGARISI